MDEPLYRELWQIRFDKMRELEARAVTDYEKLLQECRELEGGALVVRHLERLAADEKRHVKLVDELIAILARQ